MATVRRRTWRSAGEVRTTWLADYFDQERKRHQVAFKTKKEADAFLVQARHEVSRGVHTPASTSLTVAEAGELWIAQAEAGEEPLEPSTLRQRRQHLDLHLKPFIGKDKLAELGPGTVQSLRATLIREGRSRAMVKRAVASLGAILATAMTHGKLARNVVREQPRQSLAKRHKKKIEVGRDLPSKDELRRMLEHAKGRWRPLVVTAIFTGLRASELRGLRWDPDVDLDRGVLRVRQRADRWNTIGSPKSDAGKRDVPLAPMVVNTLRNWKLACPKGALGLVFPNGEGNVESLPNIHRRGLGPLQFTAGITTAAQISAKEPRLTEKQGARKAKLHPKYGLHSLRHAAASLFIEQGFPPKRVQALMGHSSIQVTFDTYGHLFPSEAEDRVAMGELQTRLIGA
jgi:integrase